MLQFRLQQKEFSWMLWSDLPSSFGTRQQTVNGFQSLKVERPWGALQAKGEEVTDITVSLESAYFVRGRQENTAHAPIIRDIGKVLKTKFPLGFPGPVWTEHLPEAGWLCDVFVARTESTSGVFLLEYFARLIHMDHHEQQVVCHLGTRSGEVMRCSPCGRT